MLTTRINPEKIGLLIGPGGKNIKGIQESTGAKIEIEDDGTVYISHSDAAGAEAAKRRVEAITEEVKVGLKILESLNLKPRRLEIVSCPSCGRALVDVYKLAEEVTAGLEGMEVPLRAAPIPAERLQAALDTATEPTRWPAVLVGEAERQAQEARLAGTRAARLPTLSLEAQLNRLGSGAAGGRTTDHGVFFKLNSTVYQGGALQAQEESARLALVAAQSLPPDRLS